MQDIPSSPPDTRPPPRRFRFSLRQLAAAVLLVAMATVIALQYRELAILRPELRKARDEAGYLSIDDPAKVYAIAVRELRPDTWSWRVHIPSGKSLWLYSKVNDIPATEFPDVPAPPSSGVDAHSNNVHVSELPPGKWLLTFGVVETPHKANSHELVCDKVGGPFRNTLRRPIDSEPHQWPRRTVTHFETRHVGKSSVESEAAAPLLLLRHRAAHTSGVIGANSGPSDGLMIWIAPSDKP